MAVRSVDDDDVDARGDQGFDALVGVSGRADCGADAELAELVLAGIRMLGRFEDVLDGDQAAELEAVVDDQDPLQPVLVHQRLRELELGAFGHGDQAVALGHDVAPPAGRDWSRSASRGW